MGLFSATSLNMAQMVGIGPFITIPLIISAIGGPQVMIGWVVGALIALCDGLVWAELGASMPRAGGTYNFLRQAFQYSTGKFMPFMFVWSTLLVTPLIMATGMIGVIPWQQAEKSTSIGSDVLHHVWGGAGAATITILIIWTAFASVFTGLLGASRLPFSAARERLFFSPFGRLHPRLRFPHISLLVMGLVTAVASFFSLTTVINALIGWVYIFQASGWAAIQIMLIWTAAGIIAFLIWARAERSWPFGPKQISEEFLAGNAQTSAATVDAER